MTHTDSDFYSIYIIIFFLKKSPKQDPLFICFELILHKEIHDHGAPIGLGHPGSEPQLTAKHPRMTLRTIGESTRGWRRSVATKAVQPNPYGPGLPPPSSIDFHVGPCVHLGVYKLLSQLGSR